MEEATHVKFRRELVESSLPLPLRCVSTASAGRSQLGRLPQQVHLLSEPSSQPYFSLIPNLTLYKILCLTAWYQSTSNMHQPVAALVPGWKDHLLLQQVTKLSETSTPKDSRWAFCATNVS